MREVLKCRIAELDVKLTCKSEFFQSLCSVYETDDVYEGKYIDLCYEEQDYKENTEYGENRAIFEYNFTFFKFVQAILEKKVFCFHASALSVDGEAILFSADSGTGKSTQARLWEQYLSEKHKVLRVNDDKPVVRMIDEKAWCYGSPWSGKHCINTNIKAPIKAVVFIKQAKENKIRKVAMQDAFSFVFPQTFLDKANPLQRVQILELLDQFIRNVPIYELACNISEEAVKLAYRTIWEEQ